MAALQTPVQHLEAKVLVWPKRDAHGQPMGHATSLAMKPHATPKLGVCGAVGHRALSITATKQPVKLQAVALGMQTTPTVQDTTEIKAGVKVQADARGTPTPAVHTATLPTVTTPHPVLGTTKTARTSTATRRVVQELLVVLGTTQIATPLTEPTKQLVKPTAVALGMAVPMCAMGNTTPLVLVATAVLAEAITPIAPARTFLATLATVHMVRGATRIMSAMEHQTLVRLTQPQTKQPAKRNSDACGIRSRLS